MKLLTFLDFQTEQAGEHTYISFKRDGKEIAIENCLNGHEVAIYDDQQELLEAKRCTNSPMRTYEDSIKALHTALSLANELYKIYFNDQQATHSKAQRGEGVSAKKN